MLIYKQLIQIDKGASTPVYLQITNAFIQGIREGRLRRNLRLPGSRILCNIICVHRKTMIAALTELESQGWIVTMPRKGTYVSKELPDVKPRRILIQLAQQQFAADSRFGFYDKKKDLFPLSPFPSVDRIVINDGFPDIRLAPVDMFNRELRTVLKRQSFRKYYHYGHPYGADILRETLSEFLSDTRGLSIRTENIMITKGAQMGIFLSAGLLIRKGDEAVVGEPGYFSALLTLRQAGANINFVPVDEQGIDVDYLEKLCGKKKIRAVYVIPHHHHPTTVTLTPDRRIRLLQLAYKYRFAIIEDDYDYDFHYSSNPLMPMASLDNAGNIIYIGTLSKTLMPAIRIGFMIGPANFIRAAGMLRRSIDWQGDSLVEAAMAVLYQNGTMMRHIKKTVRIYRERRDHFCSLLSELGDKVSFRVPDGGMSVWTKYPGKDLKKIAAEAFEKGLQISDGTIYNTNGNYNSNRLGFASIDFEEQVRAIQILSECL